MTVLWTADDAASATGGRITGDFVATGVSIDSRSVAEGDLFVALTAARDGHDFVADALARGAAGALVSRIPQGVAPDAPLLIVADVQKALEDLGRAGRARMQGQVIAVTGSVGKTTTKEMMRAAFGALGPTHASVASYNNHWGVPLTLARMPQDSAYAIIEMGMSGPNEIAPLSAMARPHLALVTTVAEAHLEAFGHIDGIAYEKAAIYSGLVEGGIALVNDDVETRAILHAAAKRDAARVIRFGHGADCEARLTHVTLTEAATVIEAEIAGVAQLFKLSLPARHLAMNALACLASVAALGGDLALAALALGRWLPVEGRGTREAIAIGGADGARIELIDDAYNANPASVAASLEVLANRPRGTAQGRRIAVLGDMLELGESGAALHAEIADLPAIDAIDRIHTVGPLMEHLHEVLPEAKRGLHCETAAEMARLLARDLSGGDVVLVKGSNSMGLARVVDGLRKLGQAIEGKQ